VFSKEFLAMVRCPENRQTLALADEALVAHLNRAVQAGTLKNRSGQTLAQTLDAAFVREDQAIVYPIIDGIPILLIDEGIPLEQVQASIGSK
jgi:uncharacterized protein YbaR (Trm112 family)